jgi:hypothetical protein
MQGVVRLFERTRKAHNDLHSRDEPFDEEQNYNSPDSTSLILWVNHLKRL